MGRAAGGQAAHGSGLQQASPHIHLRNVPPCHLWATQWEWWLLPPVILALPNVASLPDPSGPYLCSVEAAAHLILLLTQDYCAVQEERPLAVWPAAILFLWGDRHDIPRYHVPTAAGEGVVGIK